MGLHISSPQFISYLYNKDMNLTVKMSGELDDSYYLRAEIIGTDDKEIKYKHGVPSNSIKNADYRKRFYEHDNLTEQTYWEPWGNDTEDYPDPSTHRDPITTNKDLYYHGTPSDPNGSGNKYYGPWTSFLSLRKTKLLQIDGPSIGLSDNVGGSDTKNMYTVNHTYFNDNDRGWRNFIVSEGTHGDNEDGLYKVTYSKKSDNGVATERIFTVPLFTRSKELVTTSSFTGNNPYTAYPRRQRVKFYVASNEDGTAVEGIDPVYVDIIQVRRIVNPKAVWRSGDTKPEDFNVTLMWLKEDNEYDMSKEFEAFESMGPWSAEIVTGGDNIISLISTPIGSGTNAAQSGVRRIEGASEHKIDFKIHFNGNKGCAVVKVRYHNYTCEHDIFCRVGYGALALENGKAEWQTVNIESFDKDGNAIPCRSPLMEGSLFKHKSTTAILSSNNTVDQFGKIPGSLKVKKSDGTTTTMAWNEIKPSYDGQDWTINNSGEYVATWTDFQQLMSTHNESTIKKAYGVLYGDGATETATKLGDAYGYDKTNDDDDITSTKGMRGVVVYNKDTHAQIFFPIGQSGSGHRKASGSYRSDYDTGGTLRYAYRSAYYDTWSTDASRLPFVPLFADIYRRTGAMYWCRRCTATDGPNTSFDMNYHTMGFKSGDNNATLSGTDKKDGGKGDAIFLRTIKGTSPEQ